MHRLAQVLGEPGVTGHEEIHVGPMLSLPAAPGKLSRLSSLHLCGYPQSCIHSFGGTLLQGMFWAPIKQLRSKTNMVRRSNSWNIRTENAARQCLPAQENSVLTGTVQQRMDCLR